MRNPFSMFRPAPAPVAAPPAAQAPRTVPATHAAKSPGDMAMDSLLNASGCSFDDVQRALVKAKALRSSRDDESREVDDKARIQEALSGSAKWDEASAKAMHAVLARRTSAAEARVAESDAGTACLVDATLAHGARRDSATLRTKTTEARADARLGACEALLDALRSMAPDHPLLTPLAVGYSDGSPRTGIDAVSDEAADRVSESHGLPLFRDTLANGAAAA